MAPDTRASSSQSALPRLLLVDDEDLFREEFRTLLAEEGYPVEAAVSADQAIGMLERARFDVMLCDNRMPKRSGESLIQEVQSRWPCVMIVGVTGAPSERSARRMLEEGPYYYVPKPFRMEQVTRVLAVVRSEAELRGRVAPPRPASEVLGELIRSGLTVGLVSARPPIPKPLQLALPDDPRDPGTLLRAIERFLVEFKQPAVLLEFSQEWVGSHGRPEAIRLVREIRSRMEGIGPLAVGIDHEAFSHRDVLVLRESLSFPNVPFEGYGIVGRHRRAVLRALASGPKGLDQLRTTMDVGESEVIHYFLDNLLAHRLAAVQSGSYRLTKDGERAALTIGEIDHSPSVASGGSRMFTLAT